MDFLHVDSFEHASTVQCGNKNDVLVPVYHPSMC